MTVWAGAFWAVGVAAGASSLPKVVPPRVTAMPEVRPLTKPRREEEPLRGGRGVLVWAWVSVSWDDEVALEEFMAAWVWVELGVLQPFVPGLPGEPQGMDEQVIMAAFLRVAGVSDSAIL